MISPFSRGAINEGIDGLRFEAAIGANLATMGGHLGTAQKMREFINGFN